MTYVVAVSGGVDSVVLLDILVQQTGHASSRELVVAHFDHGIRHDSAQDRQFVERLAEFYELPFEYEAAQLGAGASEEAARKARYAFLRRVRDEHRARSIVTAHHEDDVFETAVINLLRGTGRRGLSSLRTTDELYRPLLKTPKKHILAYAKRHNLQWREDSTNSDTNYLRNYVRQVIMPRFDETARQRLRELIGAAHDVNVQIDDLLAKRLHLQPAGDMLDRRWFIMLPHAVAREIVAAWLRSLGILGFDRPMLERIVVSAKTYAPGKKIDVNGRYFIDVRHDRLVLTQRGQLPDQE
jgi:tRNA(Ile)-lysidine synthetase-like protein